VDVSVVGGKFNKNLPAFTGYFAGFVFLRLSRESFVALVGVVRGNRDLFYSPSPPIRRASEEFRSDTAGVSPRSFIVRFLRGK